MDVSSPDPPSFSLRQKQPPLLSSKPRSSRKVTSLFSGDTGGEPSSDDTGVKKWLSDGIGSVVSKASVSGVAAASPEKEGGQRWESQRGGGSSSGSSSSGTGTEFTSPVRAPKDASSSRFTPQRNLGGLFASPLPPPRPHRDEDANDEGAADQNDGEVSETADLILAVSPAPRSPKREDTAADETVRPPAAQAASTAEVSPVARASAAETSFAPEAPPLTPGRPTLAVTATAVALARLSPLAALAPAPIKASSSAALKTEASMSSCRCGCSPSSPSSSSSGAAIEPSVSGACCVSNKAFEGDEAMCTLEILVKRDRIGVSALSSWRVAELKRRLVHLKHFPADAGGRAAEEIILVPTFPPGSTPIEDHVRLDTLDTDVTYKARRRPAGASPQSPRPPPPSPPPESTEEHATEHE
ncbi:unnamed protein product [Scytosiphon promiscuus]